VFGRKQHTEVISRCPLFSDLSSREIQGLASISNEERYAAGDELMREGEQGHSFFVLLDGQAEVLQGGERVNTHESGAFFGEIALITHGQRTATVRATTPVRALEIRDRAFRALLGREPQLEQKVIAALGDRL